MTGRGAEPLPVVVAAGVLVRRGRRILLQQRGDDLSWGVPGGALDPGETLEDTARRELLEETGLTAGRLQLLDVYSGPEFVVRYPDGYAAYVVGATFTTTDVVGRVRIDGVETLALAWFDDTDASVLVNRFTASLLRRVGVAAGTANE